MATYYGGSGNDTNAGSTGDDLSYGGGGNDSLSGGLGNDSLSGGSANDVVDGGAGNDQIVGGRGNDTFYGGANNDEIIGDGQLYDALFYASSLLGLSTTLHVVNNSDGPITLSYIDVFGNKQAVATIAVGQTFNYATLTSANFFLLDSRGYYLDVIQGGNQTFTYSGPYADLLYGGDGDDSMLGQFGTDTLYGDAGNDTLYGGDGDDSVFGGLGNDSLLGDAGNDTLSGDDGSDTLDGGLGNDSLMGGLGTDSILGDAGNDTINAGAGDDTVYGGAGDDSIHGYISGASPDGLDGNDLIYGDAGNDTIAGDEGSDTVYGGADNDVIWGWDGKDQLYGDTGNDLIHGEIDADRLYGGDGEDTLFGGAGADSLYGGLGNDSLSSGEGDDLLSGGLGQDLFQFATGSGADLINDFDLTLTAGLTADQLDVSAVLRADFAPVKVWDITVLDDGAGSAKLMFPGGESVVLQGLSPATLQQPGLLHAMGVPCFVEGTRIATPAGARRVEDIAPGDLVVTAGGAVQPVIWHGRRAIAQAVLAGRPQLRPVRLPARGGHAALWVSPQHAVHVAALGGLVRAGHLGEIGLSDPVEWRGGVVYHHLLLPRHALICAEGQWCESFYPGPMALAMLGPLAVAEVRAALVPQLQPRQGEDLAAAYGPRCLPLLTRRHLRLWRAAGGESDSTILPAQDAEALELPLP